MKITSSNPGSEFRLWRSDQLFNIDFASYTLTDHSFSKHFHDYFMIELVVKGADNFYCNGKTYTAEAGQLVLINPGEVHTGSTVANHSLHYYSMCPDYNALAEVAERLNIKLPTDFNLHETIVNKSPLGGKFLSFFRSLNTPNASLMQQEELFFDCMYELLQGQITTESSNTQVKYEDARVNTIIDYIEANFKEELSLQQLAEQVRLNPFHVIRLFKKAVGLSPYDYMLIARTEYAKKLLRQGYKVCEAALEAGFYDSSHFNRLLNKFTGISPKFYLLSKNQYRTNFTG